MKQQPHSGGKRFDIRDHATSVPKEQLEKAKESAKKAQQQQQQKNK
jgi:hypothetical protein|nr:MAG TPA: hypothetical protein [Caudoviricetes sp.]